MTIRDALPSDLDAIEALEAECFSLPWSRATLESQLTGAGHVLIAAEENGAVAGYMGLQYVLNEGYITNVCTAADFRRRGAARALISAMTARAAELSLAFLTLEVRESNAAARALYSSMGFGDIGKRPGYYEQPTENAIIMTLFLNEA
ncbi:MAG: ribosomal protein S18-alanine N-acetyltransferase [Oscillospiraceae bacterium]